MKDNEFGQRNGVVIGAEPLYENGCGNNQGKAECSAIVEGIIAERDHYRLSVNNLQKKIAEAVKVLDECNSPKAHTSTLKEDYSSAVKAIDRALEVLK
jgi:hypothetical protein